jgi:hypothetical protein
MVFLYFIFSSSENVMNRLHEKLQYAQPWTVEYFTEQYRSTFIETSATFHSITKDGKYLGSTVQYS